VHGDAAAVSRLLPAGARLNLSGPAFQRPDAKSTPPPGHVSMSTPSSLCLSAPPTDGGDDGDDDDDDTPPLLDLLEKFPDLLHTEEASDLNSLLQEGGGEEPEEADAAAAAPAATARHHAATSPGDEAVARRVVAR